MRPVRAVAGACRASANARRFCGCCAVRIWTRSRALGVTAATLSAWRDAFLAGGEASLATRPATGEALETERLKARLGEMLLERELLEAKIALLESGRP
jgi:transposase-like protein